MANIRREFGDDLTLKNGNLGINTTTAQERVDVVGVVKGRDLNVTGVTSLTAYEGFLRADNQIIEETNLEFGNGLKASLSGEIIVGTGVTVTIGAVGLGTTSVGVGTHTIQNNIDSNAVNLAGGSEIECLKVYNTFTPPSGGTNERPYAPKPGELYYNYDFKTIEFFDGYGWRQVDNRAGAGRGILAGGYNPAADANTESNIGFINIASTGNAQNFGDLITGRSVRASSSETRALLACGIVSPTGSNIIEYITMSSSGNGIDFGDSTDQRRNHAILSSSTRAVLAGGESPANLNVMDYVQIGTLGDALDFGDLTAVRRGNTGMSSPVRGIYAGDQSDYNISSAEFITIASKGNSLDFGELDDTRANAGSASNGVRGIVAGGYNGGSRISLVSSCIMASTGNFTSFGNLTNASDRGDGMCNSTRAIFNGGFPSNDIGMDSIEFASGGSGISFGFDNVSRGQNGGFCSDSHGGLGGF